MNKNSIIITGASGSMGAEAVKAVCLKGHPVIMACRNLQKGGGIMQDILRKIPGASIELMELDMESFESIRKFAASLEGRAISGLFNNAGVISRSYTVTGDGMEQSLQVNYAGPYLLTRLLLGNMETDAHIVNMVSLTARHATLSKNCFNRGAEKFNRLSHYATSKLALQSFSMELGRRLAEGLLGEELKEKNIHVNMADPGIVNSNMLSMGRWFDPLADIFFRPFCKTPEQGVSPAVRALFTDEYGKYFVGGECRDAPSAHPLSAWLWDESESQTGLR